MRTAVRAVAFCVVALAIGAGACSWAPGYFFQVTRLRGTVVSKGWFAKRPVAKAELVLLEYRGLGDRRPATQVAKVTADERGWFEFPQVPTGHYTLQIRGGNLADLFDVEVVQNRRPTDHVVIDITHVTPDCKGGHIFTVFEAGGKA